MNIREAKEEIKRILQAQFWKDDKGGYGISPENRRAVLLAGAVGIGKKSAVRQIATECGASLVTFNMTHLTEEMAKGRSQVEEKRYGGRTYTVLDYTMSEIIAAVYDTMEESGVRRGILFIEDVNLVPPELVPVVLQLITEKKLGTYAVPAEYGIVLSMSQPAVHPSIREFPPGVSDKLIWLAVEPDYAIWREYADKQVLHPAVLSYMQYNPAHLCRLEPKESGIDFVTPRGWEDLSAMLYAYENFGHEVSLHLVSSYLRDEDIARAFTDYLQRFRGIAAQYRLPEILAGKVYKRSIRRLQNADEAERTVLFGWIEGELRSGLQKWYRKERVTKEVLPILKDWKARIDSADAWEDTSFTALLAEYEERRQELLSGGSSDKDAMTCMDMTLEFLQEESMNVFGAMTSDDGEAYGIVRKDFERFVKSVESEAERIGTEMAAVFAFIRDALGDGAELAALRRSVDEGFYGSYYRETIEKTDGE